MAKGQPIDTYVHSGEPLEIDKLFNMLIKAGGSDLHLKVGLAPRLRIDGVLRNTKYPPFTQKNLEKLIFEMISENQREYFMETGAFDFAHSVSDSDRFRVNIFRQKGTVSLVARHISGKIPPFESLNLPQIVQDIAKNAHDGLVLVTGPTGCGKSTTIASMIDYVNRHRACHIITIEDPIEFLYVDSKASVSQREVGIDVTDYDAALRSLMRQDPDVVLIGEMRDNETLTAAMRAAETGHLVFGTLHASSATQTIQRILDLFPQNERDLARQTFALTMKAIVSQQLLKGLQPQSPMVPAVEVLLSNPITRKLISEEREADIPTAIRSARSEGMQDFTDSLEDLVKREMITLEEAMRCAPNVEELKMALKGVRTSASGLL